MPQLLNNADADSTPFVWTDSFRWTATTAYDEGQPRNSLEECRTPSTQLGTHKFMRTRRPRDEDAYGLYFRVVCKEGINRVCFACP